MEYNVSSYMKTPIGTPIESAFDSISPWDPAKIWSKDKLLQIDYTPMSPITTEDKILCNTLKNTIVKINEFFWDKLKLVGVDDKGKIPPLFVHLAADNAYYHPQTESYPECFKFNNIYVNHPEVVCHEFTHGVVENIRKIKELPPLGNAGEAGAINESIADIVGVVFKQSTGKIDWKIVDRDLSQKFTYSNLESRDPKEQDNGNVHYNSRHLSHAFFLTYQSCKNFIKVEKLLQTWLDAALNFKEPTFTGFVAQTISSGNSKLGTSYKKDIQDSWVEVGYEFRKTDNFEFPFLT